MSRHRSPLARSSVALLLLVLLLASLAPTWRHPSAAAGVTLATTDRLLAPPRGTPEKVLRYAEAVGATRPLETRRYINEVYRLAPLVGLDPAVVVAQSSLETGGWTSSYWTDSLNPAGIRITASGVSSYTWATGTAAARYHLVHLYIYAAGAIDPGNPLYPFRADGPGYQNAVALGYGGRAHTIADLTGTWAVDPNYAAKIVSRGNAMFAASPSDPDAPRVATVAPSGSEGGTAAYATDGDPGTVWSVGGTSGPPTGASLTIDLGRSHRLSSVRWLFGVGGRADAWTLQTSPNGTSWTVLASYGNASSHVWQAHAASGTARYVRFAFSNPNGDAKLGGIAEVEVYGVWTNGTPAPTATPYPIPTATRTPIPTGTPTRTATATATATSTPTASPTSTAMPTPVASPVVLQGEPLPIVGGGGSGSGNWSGYARDGDARTTWQTGTTPPPPRAQVYVDLGEVRAMTGLEWLFRRTSGARPYAIEVSPDKVTWTRLSAHAGSTPLAWQRVALAAEARYVRFAFDGGGVSQLGYLAEMRVYSDFVAAGEVPEPSATATSTATPEPSATPLPTEPAPTTAVPTSTETPVEPASPVASPLAEEVA